MLQKINQKYDKTPKVNTRNTHQYQLVHFSKHFQLQQHAIQSVVTWHMQCVYEGDGLYHMLLFISLSTFAAADFNLNPNYL